MSHATKLGVITLLSLIAQILVDATQLASRWQCFIRIGTPIAGLLLSARFFFSVASPMAAAPNQAVYLIYLGTVLLLLSVLALGIGLLRAP